jgi:hypothetical protein
VNLSNVPQLFKNGRSRISIPGSGLVHVDPWNAPRFKHFAKVCNQLCIVDLAKAVRVPFQLRKRLPELRPRPIHIAATEVVHSDGGLDQTLVKEA